MPEPPLHPVPQPTESEAIIAAQRAPANPGTPLVDAVPLPVDVAAALPTAPAKAAALPLKPPKTDGGRR
jgi:hypothetical protein